MAVEYEAGSRVRLRTGEIGLLLKAVIDSESAVQYGRVKIEGTSVDRLVAPHEIEEVLSRPETRVSNQAWKYDLPIDDCEVGWVYALTHPRMPGIVKIGYTSKSVRERVLELSTTGLPGPFEIAYQLLVMEPRTVAPLEVIQARRRQALWKQSDMTALAAQA